MHPHLQLLTHIIVTIIAVFIHSSFRDVLQKKRLYVGIFPILWGGLTQTHFFCLFAKFFFACQNHPEVLKHVLQ